MNKRATKPTISSSVKNKKGRNLHKEIFKKAVKNEKKDKHLKKRQNWQQEPD